MPRMNKKTVEGKKKSSTVSDIEEKMLNLRRNKQTDLIKL